MQIGIGLIFCFIVSRPTQFATSTFGFGISLDDGPFGLCCKFKWFSLFCLPNYLLLPLGLSCEFSRRCLFLFSHLPWWLEYYLTGIILLQMLHCFVLAPQLFSCPYILPLGRLLPQYLQGVGRARQFSWCSNSYRPMYCSSQCWQACRECCYF